MPNWCENELIIRGRKKDVNRFFKMMGKTFDFNKIIPYPEEFRLRDEWAKKVEKVRNKRPEKMTIEEIAIALKDSGEITDGYNSGGYEWCRDNWGTKWNAFTFDCERIYKNGKAKLIYRFETAWSPPIPVIKEAGKKFPELDFKLSYKEPGVGFTGGLRIKNGIVVSDWIKGL